MHRLMKLLYAFLSVLICYGAHADDAVVKVGDLSIKFGALVDTYYGYDFDNPTALDESYTTVASRHNEFNVNLAYIDAKISSEKIRGRVALQTGTSVTVNYAGESNGLGSINGPGQSKTPPLAENIQEATLGYRVTDKLWIDAGIMFSYLGFDGWITKNNWTYLHSMESDFSPYYQSGVRATYQWSDELSTQLNVMNGWGNIYETNENKALGLQVAYAPKAGYTLTYSNFWGNEVSNLYRFFNDFILMVPLTSQLKMALVYDLGLQARPLGAGTSVWQSFTGEAHYQLSPVYAMTVRGEYFRDPNQVIAVTGTPNGFQTWGASINGDLTLAEHLLWRNELRARWSKGPIFPGKSGNMTQDSVLVTSVTLGL
jgi:hypothetical protein